MMTTTANVKNDKGVFSSGWHKTPNAMIDLILGSKISPSAAWVVMTVIRYTEGMGGKKSALIPTATFKRVLGTKRDHTVYSYINEAIESGLITVVKNKGCVSAYSINEDCDLWRKAVVVAESAPTSSEEDTTPLTESDSTPLTESDSTPLTESDSTPLTESATLIKTKESIKENSKEESFEDFDKSYELFKTELKRAGLIPVNERINDDQLKPAVYNFITWADEKEITGGKRLRAAATWFSKITMEERKRFYTFPDEVNRSYYNPDDYPKTVPMTEEEAAAIRAKYIGSLGF